MNIDREALEALAEARGISVEALFGALAEALGAAYEKMPDAHEYAWVDIDTVTGEVTVKAQYLDDDGMPYGDEFDVTPDDDAWVASLRRPCAR